MLLKSSSLCVLLKVLSFWLILIIILYVLNVALYICNILMVVFTIKLTLNNIAILVNFYISLRDCNVKFNNRQWRVWCWILANRVYSVQQYTMECAIFNNRIYSERCLTKENRNYNVQKWTIECKNRQYMGDAQQ